MKIAAWVTIGVMVSILITTFSLIGNVIKVDPMTLGIIESVITIPSISWAIRTLRKIKQQELLMHNQPKEHQ